MELATVLFAAGFFGGGVLGALLVALWCMPAAVDAAWRRGYDHAREQLGWTPPPAPGGPVASRPGYKPPPPGWASPRP